MINTTITCRYVNSESDQARYIFYTRTVDIYYRKQFKVYIQKHLAPPSLLSPLLYLAPPPLKL